MDQSVFAQYGFLHTPIFTELGEFGTFETIPAIATLFVNQREALALTQKQVAQQAGINIRQYQKFESGERSFASTSFRIGLNVCAALQIDPRFFTCLN